jgi:hypothetical protein
MALTSAGIAKTLGYLGSRIGFEFSLLPQDEQTRLTWAKTIRSFDEVPEVYRACFASAIGDTIHLPYTVLTPPFIGPNYRTLGALVWCRDGILNILEQAGNEPRTTCYPLENVNYVQTGSVLLFSWIKISGITIRGNLTSSELRFNTVSDYMFAPIIEAIRQKADGSKEAGPSLDQSEFDCLSHSHYKLMNYAKRSLRPGNPVILFVLQDEIREEVFRLFRYSFCRTLCPSHISILTNKELVLIEDGLSTTRGGSIRYGGVWHFIPLNKINSISLTDATDNLISLSIGLPKDDHIKVHFSPSNKERLERLRQRVSALSVSI